MTPPAISTALLRREEIGAKALCSNWMQPVTLPYCTASAADPTGTIPPRASSRIRQAIITAQRFLGALPDTGTAGHETVLHSFTGGADGANPLGGVVLDPEGNLYGTTFNGGSGKYLACFGGPCGVVFKLDPSGRETVLHSFKGPDGDCPVALIRDVEGNLYGVTKYGGAGYGVVFKLDTTGTETLLYTFKGLEDGSTPVAGVIRDAAGNLYGTTQLGGAFGAGVVFKLAH